MKSILYLSETTQITFPCLLKNKYIDLVVFAVKDNGDGKTFVGVVMNYLPESNSIISKGTISHNAYPIGYISHVWGITAFKKYNGNVTLSNE